MRMTAIHVQTERKRQDGSVRRAEKHRRRSRTVPLRGLIRPVFAACAASDAAQGAKRLSGGRIQATLASEGTATWGMSDHTLLWPRVAIVNAEGEFQIVREASAPVIPSPYLMQLDDPDDIPYADLRETDR